MPAFPLQSKTKSATNAVTSFSWPLCSEVFGSISPTNFPDELIPENRARLSVFKSVAYLRGQWKCLPRENKLGEERSVFGATYRIDTIYKVVKGALSGPAAEKKERIRFVFMALFHTKWCSIAMIAIMRVPGSHAFRRQYSSSSVTFCGNYDLSPADLGPCGKALCPISDSIKRNLISHGWNVAEKKGPTANTNVCRSHIALPFRSTFGNLITLGLGLNVLHKLGNKSGYLKLEPYDGEAQWFSATSKIIHFIR